MTACKVVIVGAGPAGMSAAIAAYQAGSKVTILDEAPQSGGQIFRRPSKNLYGKSYASKAEQSRKSVLLEAFDAISQNIEFVPQAQVISAFSGLELQYVVNGHIHTKRADAVILATGVREKLYPFEGWTLPGVLGAGGAQSILKTQMVAPGKRMVIAGAGPLPIVVAAQMIRAGVDVHALANIQSIFAMGKNPMAMFAGKELIMDGLGYLATLLKARTQVLRSYAPIRAIGNKQLEAVIFARIDKSGNAISGTEKTIETDVLALNYGFVSNSELAAMFGVQMQYSELSGWHAKADELGRTTVPCVYVCGDATGLRGSFVAQSEGSIVGRAAVEIFNGISPKSSDTEFAGLYKTRNRHLRFQKTVAASLKLPEGLWDLSTPDTIICRCESINKNTILTALDQGHTSLNAIKKNTRCGMGWCGGRSCLHSVSSMASFRSGIPPLAPVTARPLARPVSLGELASPAEDYNEH